MLAFITIIHLIVCVLLTIVILMQASKGGGLSGAFGGQGGSMGAVFGGRGAGDFLSKATIVLATIFLLGSLAQGLLKRGGGGARKSLIQQEAQKQVTPSAADMLPKLPGEPAVAPTTNQTNQPVTNTRQDTSKK